MPCSLFPEPFPTRWTAWQRIPPSKRWTKVVEADCEAECREKLWALPFAGKFRDVVVLPEGRNPNIRRRFL
jgi:hypothetical protein